MAGGGGCDSPGHFKILHLPTYLDVESQKVVEFDAVYVSQVANSYQMVKKGFGTTLGHIEGNGIKVDTISTDKHPQIKKDMRVNHADIDHQFHP